MHGGFQDNGNFITFNDNITSPWSMPFNGDGAFGGIANNEEDFYLTTNKKDIRNLKVSLRYNGPLVAPIQKGEKVADLIVTNKDEKIKTLSLHAAEDIKKVNFFKSLVTSINYLIWGDV